MPCYVLLQKRLLIYKIEKFNKNNIHFFIVMQTTINTYYGHAQNYHDNPNQSTTRFNSKVEDKVYWATTRYTGFISQNINKTFSYNNVKHGL